MKYLKWADNIVIKLFVCFCDTLQGLTWAEYKGTSLSLNQVPDNFSEALKML